MFVTLIEDTFKKIKRAHDSEEVMDSESVEDDEKGTDP